MGIGPTEKNVSNTIIPPQQLADENEKVQTIFFNYGFFYINKKNKLLTGLEDDDAFETSVLGGINICGFKLVNDVIQVADTCQQCGVLVT